VTILESIATICAGLFSGAAVYINLAQHPAAAALDTPSAVAFFRSMYARAAPMQAALAAVGSLAALSAWWGGSGGLWLLASLLLGSVIPLTLIVIKPTVDRLHDSALDASPAEVRELLARWGALHALRSSASEASFLVCVLALLGG
jgi:hypothetical protein